MVVMMVMVIRSRGWGYVDNSQSYPISCGQPGFSFVYDSMATVVLADRAAAHKSGISPAHKTL